jgi:hypothetical protein
MYTELCVKLNNHNMQAWILLLILFCFLLSIHDSNESIDLAHIKSITFFLRRLLCFVISKFFYRFSERIRTFYRKNQFLREKKNPSLCRLSNIVVWAITYFLFNLLLFRSVICWCFVVPFAFSTILTNSFGWLRSNSSAFF